MPVSVKNALKRKPTPAYLALTKFLDSCPVDMLYTVNELMDAVDIGSKDTICRLQRCFDLSAYQERAGRGTASFWGHPKAIQLLRATKLKKARGAK